VDPITVATKSFLRELDRFWKRYPERCARLIAPAGDRTHVIKALRLAEYDPLNRRPLFLYDAAFTAAEPYFAGLCERAAADYELVRKGAAEEGVSLAPLELPPRPAALSMEAHAAAVLDAVAERLASRLEGALVALLPKSIADDGQWRKSIERLSRAPRPASLRIAVLDPDDGPLSSVLGPEGARFSFAIDELFDFAEQQTSRTSEGPPLPPGPSLSREQRAAYEQATGRKVPKPEAAAALQALFLKGARASAKKDFKGASDAYRRARDLCHDEGLAVEEAAAVFALAGAHLAAGARPMAQATYGQAALLAAQEKLWTMACQAKLGEAGVGWMEKDYGRAARAYSEAAALAERGEIAPLQIEALRMEGICHQHRGAEPEAILAWRKAIDAGVATDEPARRASSFREVVTALADVLEQRGLRPQAAHLRALLDERPPAGEAPPT
jgi:tetratricopeptide (TPR) repeat protein